MDGCDDDADPNLDSVSGSKDQDSAWLVCSTPGKPCSPRLNLNPDGAGHAAGKPTVHIKDNPQRTMVSEA